MVFRLEPQGRPQDYKTYQVVAPTSTHTRAATCDEVGCEAFSAGWRTILAVDQADMIATVRRCGRKFTETRQSDLIEFVFPAGQACFKSTTHRLPVGKPPLFIVKDGDYRGNPRGTTPRVHVRPEDWLDDFATHQQALADRIKEG